MKNLLVVACLSISLLTLSHEACARETVPIVDHIDVPVVTGSGKRAAGDKVRDMIAAAATSGKWEISTGSEKNTLVAALHVRNRHTAVVSIPYSADKFSIKYQNSTNMRYQLAEPAPTGSIDLSKINSPAQAIQAGTPMIHPSYNKWVQDLLHSIQSELKKL